MSAGLVSYLILFGTLFVVPYYLLSSEHASAALVWLQLSAIPIAIAIAAPIAGRLVNCVGGRLLTGGGLTLAAAGLFEIALLHDTAGLIVGLAIAGVGLGTFSTALYTAAAGTSAAHDVADGARGLTLALVALALLAAATGLMQLAGRTPVSDTADNTDRHRHRPQRRFNHERVARPDHEAPDRPDGQRPLHRVRG